MSMVTIILLIMLMMLVIGTLCVACFFIGAKVGQKVSKGEELQIPNLDPVKAYREHQVKKQEEQESEKYRIIFENIDNYNGTKYGQKDVPR